MLTLLLYVAMLAIAGAGWILILWFGINPDFNKWSDPVIIAMHALPPIAFCFSWWAGKKLIDSIREQQRKAREKQEEAEKQAATDAARKQHAQDLQRQRFACDCRLIVIGDLAVHGKFALPNVPHVRVQTVAADVKVAAIAEDSLLDALEPALIAALRKVYEQCGAAVVLPLAIVPPARLATDHVIQWVRNIHRQLMKDMTLKIKPAAGVPAITLLPSADGASNSIIALFDHAPDLPGVVVLAFDSPLSQAGHADIEQQQGKPSHGVCALLITPANLLAIHEDLAQLPVLARLHRAAFLRMETTPSRAQELSRTLAPLLEQANIQAGWKDVPRCGWLVHNAGPAQHAPHRLPAISAALTQCKLDVHPIEMVNNITLDIGNVGRAIPVVMLGIALVQTRTRQMPGLCIEFLEKEGIAVALTVPVPVLPGR